MGSPSRALVAPKAHRAALIANSLFESRWIKVKNRRQLERREEFVRTKVLRLVDGEEYVSGSELGFLDIQVACVILLPVTRCR